VWSCYTKYGKIIKLGNNLFLKGLSQTHKIEIFGGFVVAVCLVKFSQPCDAPLVESTVADTLNHLAATFRENEYNNPKWDPKRNVSQL
jgi:hypothetical protein